MKNTISKTDKANKDFLLDSLKKKRAALRTDLDNVINDIDKIELENALPDLKRKYEGKYFVFQDSYSGGNKWNMYIYCKKITGINHFTGIFFQIMPGYENNSSEILINVEKSHFISSFLRNPISKKTFIRELKKFEKQTFNILNSLK